MEPATSELAHRQRRALGWNIRCPRLAAGGDIGRDVQLTAGPDGLKRLAVVEGIPALIQALEIALTTALGSDVFNTGFGFDGIRAMAEETDPLLTRERIRVAVIDVLRREPRVRRILDVKLSGGQLELPDPGSRVFNVRVEFETITGQPGAVTLQNTRVQAHG